LRPSLVAFVSADTVIKKLFTLLFFNALAVTDAAALSLLPSSWDLL
jgi:hypothetical protein